MGRFLSVDPLVGNPLSAQDYNGYSYCGNNPLAFTDPSGYQKYAVPMPYCYPGNEFYLTRLFGSIPGGGFGGGGGGDDPSGYYPSALDDSPRSMFDWWTPYQNSKKQGNTATPMQYLNDVNRGKNYWTEEYSRDQDMADYKKDLAVFPNSLRGEMRIVIKHYYSTWDNPLGEFLGTTSATASFLEWSYTSDATSSIALKAAKVIPGRGVVTAAELTRISKIEAFRYARYAGDFGVVVAPLAIVATGISIYNNPTTENWVLGSADIVMTGVSIFFPVAGVVYFGGRFIYEAYNN